ncbi:hypothetical protein Tco_1519407, partial [Tanacetum coccineum]
SATLWYGVLDMAWISCSSPSSEMQKALYIDYKNLSLGFNPTGFNERASLLVCCVNLRLKAPPMVIRKVACFGGIPAW